MVINELHIAAFGGLVERDIVFDKGLNVIEGENESGKTSAAMFIKFIFYGLSGKSTGGSLSERKRYVNFQKGMASGYLICTESGVRYRIERNLYIVGDSDSSTRESVRIVNLSDGSIINGGVPGEYFFGVNESMFVNTVFVGQLANIKPDGDGLGGAVENMLCTADENVNLKKAVERLNAARREIQHKNGNGGEIVSLKEERAAIAEEIKNSSEISAEIIELEASLSDSLEKKSLLEHKKAKLDGIFKALDAILIKKKLDAVRQTEEKISKLTKTVQAIDSSGFLESYDEKLNSAERDIRAYNETEQFYAEKQNYKAGKAETVRNANNGAAFPPAELIDEASYLDTKSRVQFSLAIAMIVAGIIGLAASFAMYYFNTETYMLPLIMTGCFAVIGVVLFIFQNRTLKNLYEILDEWGAETVDDLENAVSLNAKEPAAADDYDEFSDNIDIEELRGKRDEAVAVINSMAAMCGISTADDPCVTSADVRSYAEKLEEERENMKARIANFSGRLSVLKEQVSSVDKETAEKDAAAVIAGPYGKLALSLDTEGIKRVIRERDFVQGAYKSQLQRIAELEKSLAELKQHTKSPAEAASRLCQIDDQINELELKRDGYNLAVDALKKAGENMRSGVVPKLTAYASDIMSSVVGGKYTSLILDSNFSMNYMNGAETRSVEHMSKGTYDAAYISLRLALMRVIFRGAIPPVVLDESFAYIDEERFVSLLRCIAASDVQSIFFTCREREAVHAHRSELRGNIIAL